MNSLERWWLNAWPHRWKIRRTLPRFLKSCPEPFRGQVLEVGAGTGWTSRRILETFPQVELTATDSDPSAVEKLNHLQDTYGQRLHVQPAAIEKLPFDRAAFDIVVAFNVIHHVDSLQTAYLELLRVLRPGGLLGVSDQLLTASAKARLAELETLLKNERCEVTATRGRNQYTLWARKPYSLTTSPVS